MKCIPIERVDRPQPETLYRKYISVNHPVIITGVANRWPAVLRWTPDYLKSRFGNEMVRARPKSGNPTGQLTQLGSLIDAMKSTDNPNDQVVVCPIFKHIPELKADIEPLDSYMGLPWCYPARLRRELIAEQRLFIGPAGYGAALHFDGRNNFFVQVYGRKRFVLISPAQSRYVYYPATYPNTYFSPVDVIHPDFEAFPLFKKATLFEAVIGPGDVLFIPVRWWHMVLALDQSISLSSWWGSARVMLRMWHPSLVNAKAKLRTLIKPSKAL